MAKTIRLRDPQSEQVVELARKLSYENNITVKESDIIHALVDKGLISLSLDDIKWSIQNSKNEKS